MSLEQLDLRDYARGGPKRWSAEVTDHGETIIVTVFDKEKPTPMRFKDAYCKRRNDFSGYEQLRVRRINNAS